MKRSGWSSAVGLGVVFAVRGVVGFQLQQVNQAVCWPSCRYLPSLSILRATTAEYDLQETDEATTHQNEDQTVLAFRTTDELNSAIGRLCNEGKRKEAVDLLRKIESSLEEDMSEGVGPEQSTYVALINGLTDDVVEGADQAERLLRHMEQRSSANPSCTPATPAYSAVIFAFSKSKRKDAAEKADDLLVELWSHYIATDDQAYLPTRATYVSTISAWARSGLGLQAAERAEALLEEMEAHRAQHPDMGPNTACVNAVLNAWSKSGDRGAADRCETIIERMESLALQGREELRPDTVSFNTAIDTLARSRQRDGPRRAEEMLNRMRELGRTPDVYTYNTVINSWARSREPAAARRAEAILRHMERQFESGASNVQPDAASYNNVIHAWSMSSEEDATQRAESVLRRMESAHEKGNERARPDLVSYNSMINVWSKSRHPEAGERALEILRQMKEHDECRPDIFAYTSVIDCLAKCGSLKSSEQAIALLAEVESEYEKSGEAMLRPNIRSYTGAINAVARSRQDSERAEAILERLETMADSGKGDIRPDTVCYNAVINAIGWSDSGDKATRAYAIYERMLDRYNSGDTEAKPDIVTCNSILNACAFDKAENEVDRANVMSVAVKAFETFQSQASTFGFPNHITYSDMLLCISRLMPMSEKRQKIAETVFYQCCQTGHVSSLAISLLRNALDHDRLGRILGSALIVNDKENFRYNMNLLPREWRKNAPRPKGNRRRNGRSS